MKNDLIYQVNQTPPFWKNMVFALQQVLAIITATILVPIIADKTGVYLSQSAALIGAGVGTLIYLLCTKFKSPVFLGSSFAFITPLTSAVAYGYFGILLGSIFAGAVYLILALVIKFAGANWINKIMPPVIIGPIVALIGFDLSESAINNLMSVSSGYNIVGILVGVVTFLVVVLISVKGNKKIKMYPFIIGMLSGYLIACVFTIIGNSTNCEILKLVDFSAFSKITDFKNWLPNFTFVGAIKEGFAKIGGVGDVISIFIAFTPIALVSFAEHIADHKNISSIINSDLFVEPGLHRTLVGDGLGSIVGALFGGCPNTTYGESIGCVALSKNASTKTILTASIMCVIIAFFYPAIAFFETIPTCVIGGICIALYGFISVSGFRMFKDTNLNDTKNLFIVSAIFITGIGGLELRFGAVKITNIACALMLGIVVNLLLNSRKNKNIISDNSELLESDNTIIDDESVKDEKSIENKTKDEE